MNVKAVAPKSGVSRNLGTWTLYNLIPYGLFFMSCATGPVPLIPPPPSIQHVMDFGTQKYYISIVDIVGRNLK